MSNKKQIRLTEQALYTIVRNVAMRVIREGFGEVEQEATYDRPQKSNELYNEWYEVEDYDGNYGKKGDYRSYELGHTYWDNMKADAKEMGYKNFEDYLWFWFDEVLPDLPWYWYNDKSYNGIPVYQHDGFVFYDLNGQVILNEYAIGDARRDLDFEHRLKSGEYWTK